MHLFVIRPKQEGRWLTALLPIAFSAFSGRRGASFTRVGGGPRGRQHARSPTPFHASSGQVFHPSGTVLGFAGRVANPRDKAPASLSDTFIAGRSRGQVDRRRRITLSEEDGAAMGRGPGAPAVCAPRSGLCGDAAYAGLCVESPGAANKHVAPGSV